MKNKVDAMQPRQKAWLVSGLAVIIYFEALSIHADQFLPGGKWTLLFLMIVAAPAMYLVSLAIERAKSFWKRLEFRWKLLLVFVLCVFYSVISFLDNRHKADPVAENVISGLFLVIGLFLLGLYSLMSRGLDALWLRFKRHKS